MKKTKSQEKIIFKNGLPPKNKLALSLMYLKAPLLFPFVQWYIKKQFKKSDPSVGFIPGFINFYGNIYADKKVFLSDTFCLDYAPIYIGENTRFSWENMLVTSYHERGNFETVIAEPIYIGKNVWITSRCTILGGVTIGDNSVIGAGSVVTKNIPANCFAAGNPAKPIKYFKK